MGLTDSDHRQPGSNVARPITASPSLAISTFPFGNSRTSSLPTALLPPAIAVPPRLESQRTRLTTDAERRPRRADDVERAAHQHQVVGRRHGEGAGQPFG